MKLVVASFGMPSSDGPIHMSTVSISGPSVPSILRRHTGIHRGVYKPLSLKYLRPCPSILLYSQQLISTSSDVGLWYSTFMNASHLSKMLFVDLTPFHSAAATCIQDWCIMSKTSIASSSEGFSPIANLNSRSIVRKAPATKVHTASTCKSPNQFHKMMQ